MRKLVVVISYSLGTLFMYTAISKLNGYGKFEATIGQSAMLTPYASVLAWAVPSLEILIAVMLVFKGLRQFGLYASLGLMAAFTAYVFIILQSPEKPPCNCGGVVSEMNWSQHLVFNIVFTVMAGVGITLTGLRPPLPGRERDKIF